MVFLPTHFVRPCKHKPTCTPRRLIFCYTVPMNLTDKKCKPCELGEGKLTPADSQAFMTQVPKWTLKDDHDISREFIFKNFAEALAFVNKVGALAESEGHHPTIRFGWGYAEITTFTHAVDGLSENDFILASKIDRL